MEYEPVGHGLCRISAVLIIDDHPLYGDALSIALESEFSGCEIKTATSLGEGTKSLKSGFLPDLVLLDLKLPDVTGISGLLRLRDHIPDTPIIVVSALASHDVIQAVMDAGAKGFVSKDAPMQVIRDALWRVHKGETLLPEGFRPSRNVVHRHPEAYDINQKIADLTPQQSKIMKLICAGKPNKQIAYEMSLAEATVKAHITALLRRLGVQNRTQAAVLVESASLAGGMGADSDGARAFLSH